MTVYIYKVAFRGAKTEGSNPATDRSKLGTKRYILTDKNGIPLSAIITSASNHDVKAVTDAIDNVIVKRPTSSSVTKERRTKRKRRKHTQQYLCLDRAHSSKSVKQQIIKRGYVPQIPYKRKRGEKKVDHEKISIKRYPARRWVIERTNSWHNRFRNLFIRYEKKAIENYLDLVQLSCSIIIY
ncbi:MAG: transposase [Candidatus Nitrosocosmicus sp.]